jgi:hypothetical protein
MVLLHVVFFSFRFSISSLKASVCRGLSSLPWHKICRLCLYVACFIYKNSVHHMNLNSPSECSSVNNINIIVLAVIYYVNKQVSSFRNWLIVLRWTTAWAFPIITININLNIKLYRKGSTRRRILMAKFDLLWQRLSNLMWIQPLH